MSSTNWKDSEIRDLLKVRGEFEIMKNIRGTAQDSVTYDRLTSKLHQLGTHRTKQQIISKLKTIKRHYHEVGDHNKKSGNQKRNWCYFELCDAIWGVQKPPSPATGSGSPAEAPSLPEDSSEAGCSNTEALQDGPTTTACSDNQETQDSPTDDFCSIPAPPVPLRKRKGTIMQQVSNLVAATMEQLNEMDAVMQAKEDARLQKLMAHEREMQNSLISQLTDMSERISRENHQRNLELVDKILARFPSSSTDH